MTFTKIKFVLFSIFILNNSFGQVDTNGYAAQRLLVKKTNDQVDNLQDLKLFDNLFNDSLITIPNVQAMVYMARAEKHWDYIYDYLMIHSYEVEDDNTVGEVEPHFKAILEDYNKAIAMCPECAIEYQFHRFIFLEELKNYSSLYDAYNTSYLPLCEIDYKLMKSYGYKEDRAGFGIGLNALHGKENWLGGELSFITFKEHINRLKYKSPVDSSVQRYWINKYPVMANWFTLGYNYGLTSKSHDIYIDFLNITSPIHFSFLKFGALKTYYSEKLLWYYRPEIGVGFANVSVYYAYNVIFKKSMRDISERHLIGIRIKLIGYHYPTGSFF